MSKPRIYWFGRKSSDPLLDSTDTFIQRLQKTSPVELIRLKESQPSKEADDLLPKLSPQTYVVALDERGEILTTQSMYDKISTWKLDGRFNTSAFVIGGADGLDPRVKDRANELWRLSSLTLPHRFALALLTEQLYRVEQIRLGGPYHRA